MVQVRDAVVHGGQIVIDGLPFQDGQHVRVSVEPAPFRLTIAEAQRLVAGSSDVLDDPGEPMIPLDSWEMLK